MQRIFVRPDRAMMPAFSRATRLLAVCGFLSACNVSDLVDVDRPASVTDPEVLKSYNGALSIYGAAVGQFARVLGSDGSTPYALLSGFFSDELQAVGISSFSVNPLDARILPEGDRTYSQYNELFFNLQNSRLKAEQGIGALLRDAPAAPRSLAGELFGLTSFSEIMLGEYYCSGVPLSSAPFNKGDIIYGASLTTAQVFEHALAAADSALAYSADSVRILDMARIARGRALLNLGRFAEAATAVTAVPTSFRYEIKYSTATQGTANMFASPIYPGAYSVANREGGNGLDFVTAKDPRVPTENRSGNNGSYFYLLKYPLPVSPIVVAGGTEARLIEAEASLKANDVSGWLAKLNGLRSTQITPALLPLTDPGTPSGRVDLMFRERAFWLFGTGHRLGDLRRLVRQYGRDANAVFPTGVYTSGVSYGDAVNAPVPVEESDFNPNFKGCINRDA
jgi:hypothetical protein